LIVTLTPNPSVDLLFSARQLVWDDANRLPMPRRRPGGQGINVVRAARVLDPGRPVRAVAPLAGAAGREIQEMLDAEDTPVRAIDFDGETRVFVGVREADTGRSILLNPRGTPVAESLGEVLAEGVLDTLDQFRDDGADGRAGEAWVACCGSLLPGLPPALYAEIGRAVRDRGGRFVPDCDGPVLEAALPFADLLVPNEMEAGRMVGRPARTPAEAAEAGRALIRRGPGTVVITLGEAGAVAVTEKGAWWACPVLPEPLSRALEDGSAVGAGDVLLAALLVAPQDSDLPDRLRWAVAAGTATLLSRGTELVRRADLDRILPHVSIRPLPG
jgi:1-phosphofructokinase family hexose kinase